MYPDWPSPKISLCVKLAHKINKSSKGSPQIKNGGLPKGDNVPFFYRFFYLGASLMTSKTRIFVSSIDDDHDVIIIIIYFSSTSS